MQIYGIFSNLVLQRSLLFYKGVVCCVLLIVRRVQKRLPIFRFVQIRSNSFKTVRPSSLQLITQKEIIRPNRLKICCLSSTRPSSAQDLLSNIR